MTQHNRTVRTLLLTHRVVLGICCVVEGSLVFQGKDGCPVWLFWTFAFEFVGVVVVLMLSQWEVWKEGYDEFDIILNLFSFFIWGPLLFTFVAKILNYYPSCPLPSTPALFVLWFVPFIVALVVLVYRKINAKSTPKTNVTVLSTSGIAHTPN